MAIEETLQELVKGQARTEQWQKDFDRRIDEKFDGVYERQDATNGNVGRHDVEIRVLQQSDHDAQTVHASVLKTIGELLPRLIEIEATNSKRVTADAVSAGVKEERRRLLKGVQEWAPFLLTQAIKVALLIAFVLGGIVTWGDEIRKAVGL